MPGKLWRELREIVWLASIVGGLSLFGVSAAIAAALVLEQLSAVTRV
jgi:hypothetical protein